MNHRDELYNIAEAYCRSQNWHYSADRERYLISFGMNLKNKLKSTKVWIDVKETTIVVFAVCPLNADPADRPKIAEFITRANYGLLLGNFELDYQDGEVRYKATISAMTSLPSMDDVERVVDVTFLMMQRYGDGLCKLIMGYGEPEELIKECEA